MSNNNPETTQRSSTRIDDKQIAEEWADWLADFIEVTGRTATRGGSKEAKRLFSGRRHDDPPRTVEELKEATRGCHGDEHLRAQGFDRPETILRDRNITRYIELHRARVASNGRAGDSTLAKMAARDD